MKQTALSLLLIAAGATGGVVPGTGRPAESGPENRTTPRSNP